MYSMKCASAVFVLFGMSANLTWSINPNPIVGWPCRDGSRGAYVYISQYPHNNTHAMGLCVIRGTTLPSVADSKTPCFLNYMDELFDVTEIQTWLHPSPPSTLPTCYSPKNGSACPPSSSLRSVCRYTYVPDSKIPCPPLPSPANGYVTYPTMRLSTSVARYKCYEGYELVGSPLSGQCNGTSGIWKSHTPPKCSALVKRCISPWIAHSLPLNVTYLLNEHVTVTCEKGYNRLGSTVITCQSSGTWTDVPRCERVTCPQGVKVANGSVLGLDSTPSLGTTIFFTCKEGFSLVGNVTQTCDATGAWSGRLPTCNVTEEEGEEEPQMAWINSTTNKAVVGLVVVLVLLVIAVVLVSLLLYRRQAIALDFRKPRITTVASTGYVQPADVVAAITPTTPGGGGLASLASGNVNPPRNALATAATSGSRENLIDEDHGIDEHTYETAKSDDINVLLASIPVIDCIVPPSAHQPAQRNRNQPSHPVAEDEQTEEYEAVDSATAAAAMQKTPAARKVSVGTPNKPARNSGTADSPGEFRVQSYTLVDLKTKKKNRPDTSPPDTAKANQQRDPRPTAAGRKSGGKEEIYVDMKSKSSLRRKV